MRLTPNTTNVSTTTICSISLQFNLFITMDRCFENFLLCNEVLMDIILICQKLSFTLSQTRSWHYNEINFVKLSVSCATFQIFSWSSEIFSSNKFLLELKILYKWVIVIGLLKYKVQRRCMDEYHHMKHWIAMKWNK
jgi:hypothetical protein